MNLMLATLADAGEPPPDLVVADHGFAGAAGAAGIVSVGFADCNDPALFVGEAEGDVAVCVPLDDNVEANVVRAVDERFCWALLSASGASCRAGEGCSALLPHEASPSPPDPTSLPFGTHVRDRLPEGKPAPVAC